MVRKRNGRKRWRWNHPSRKPRSAEPWGRSAAAKARPLRPTERITPIPPPQAPWRKKPTPLWRQRCAAAGSFASRVKRGRVQKSVEAGESEDSWGSGWPGDGKTSNESAGSNPKAVTVQAAAPAAASGQGLYKCVKVTLLQDCFEVKGAKSLRKVEQGEIIECLEPPRVSADYGLSRIKGRAKKDGMVGWITAWGNLGTRLLCRLAETKRSSRLAELAVARRAARLGAGGGASSSAGSEATPLSRGTSATRCAEQRQPAAVPTKGSVGVVLRTATRSAEGRQPAAAPTKGGANVKSLPRCRTPLCPYRRNTDETMNGLCCRLYPEGKHGKRCKMVAFFEQKSG